MHRSERPQHQWPPRPSKPCRTSYRSLAERAHSLYGDLGGRLWLSRVHGAIRSGVQLCIAAGGLQSSVTYLRTLWNCSLSGAQQQLLAFLCVVPKAFQTQAKQKAQTNKSRTYKHHNLALRSVGLVRIRQSRYRVQEPFRSLHNRHRPSLVHRQHREHSGQ